MQEKLETTIERFDKINIDANKPAYHKDIILDSVFANVPDRDLLADGLKNAEPWRNLISGEQGDFSVEGATRIGVNEAKNLYDRGVLFIQTNPPHRQYARLTIPGAIRGSVSKLTRGLLAKIAAKDQEIVFFSRHSRAVGQAEAAAMAVYWGYKKVYVMDGGVWEWRDAGYPVESMFPDE